MQYLKIITHVSTIIFLLIFSSCEQHNNKQDQIARLKKENRELKRARAQNEQNLYNLSETINFIQANLDTIRQQEKMISTIAHNDIENKPAAKAQISEDITNIYNKLIDNRRKLSHLQKSLSKNAAQNKDLKAIINRLNQQMEEKIVQVEQLRSQLEKMQGKITNLESLVDTLKTLKKQQENIIAYQQNKINTVYYAYGTSKELKENNVITKEGGILGIGRARKLRDSLNINYFTPINKYELQSISLNARKIRIVTPHPEKSYKIYGKKPVDSLEIIKPNQFWKNTKYLVIEIKQ